jgi:glutamate carboxypeptidase
MDTVWEVGALREMPFRIVEGRAHGPGVFDMKAGLVQVLYAIRALKETGRRPAARVVVLINSDEEVGSNSSRALIEEQARRSRAVFVLEPAIGPDGRLKTFRKGVGVFQIRVHGRAAHAGLDPGSGVSAIEELARQIQALHRMTDPARGITVNVGTVQGGTRSNVIAAEAQAEIDLRVSTLSDAREMESKILNLRPYLDGAEILVTGGVDRPPLERSAGVQALYQKARGLAEELGFELGEGSAGGGSDGNFTAALGIPTLDGLGAVGDGAHASHEHTLVSEMPRRAALLARLLETV